MWYVLSHVSNGRYEPPCTSN